MHMHQLISSAQSCPQFPERVCAFTAGDLTVFPGTTLPCLVYVTVDGRVFVYYSVRHLTEALNGTDVIDDLSAEFDELRLAMNVDRRTFCDTLHIVIHCIVEICPYAC